MKNKCRHKFKNEITREELKEMVNDENQNKKMEELIRGDLSSEDEEMLFDVIRESRMDTLFDALDVDRDKLAKAKKKIIKLHPQSEKWPFISTLYRDHKGKYKVETLINEYHDSTLAEGLQFGITYGNKFIAEDIQNGRFSRDDILNMTKEELNIYCDEDREEI